MSEEELLRKAGRGDEAAFLILYQGHRDCVFRFAYRMLGSIAPAEDITQDCFLDLIRNPGRFNPARASLRSYLYGAARNLALKYFRRQGTEIAVAELPEAAESPGSGGPLRELLDEEAATAVRNAVAELPPLQREALVLFEYEELSLAEIALIVETDVGTVKARLHRARARLRKLLISNCVMGGTE